MTGFLHSRGMRSRRFVVVVVVSFACVRVVVNVMVSVVMASVCVEVTVTTPASLPTSEFDEDGTKAK